LRAAPTRTLCHWPMADLSVRDAGRCRSISRRIKVNPPAMMGSKGWRELIQRDYKTQGQRIFIFIYGFCLFLYGSHAYNRTPPGCKFRSGEEYCTTQSRTVKENSSSRGMGLYERMGAGEANAMHAPCPKIQETEAWCQIQKTSLPQLVRTGFLLSKPRTIP
jgi:hypothetical protein